MTDKPVKNCLVNIVFAGLGGQGVIRVSDVMAFAAFHAGFDVKKSETHGMSQRNGIVTSHVRFGERVWSPMVTEREADFLLTLDSEVGRLFHNYICSTGIYISPLLVDFGGLPRKKSMNIALLGILSNYLPIGEMEWLMAVKNVFSGENIDLNWKAFLLGRLREKSRERLASTCQAVL